MIGPLLLLSGENESNSKEVTNYIEAMRYLRPVERGKFKNRRAIDEPRFDETRKFMQQRLLRQIKRRWKQNLHCGDYFSIIAFCPHSILSETHKGWNV